jgi:hypothetical protein
LLDLLELSISRTASRVNSDLNFFRLVIEHLLKVKINLRGNFHVSRILEGRNEPKNSARVKLRRTSGFQRGFRSGQLRRFGLFNTGLSLAVPLRVLSKAKSFLAVASRPSSPAAQCRELGSQQRETRIDEMNDARLFR